MGEQLQCKTIWALNESAQAENAMGSSKSERGWKSYELYSRKLQIRKDISHETFGQGHV